VKRRLIIVAVFLLAGAVVTVAVAWGCATWVSLMRSPARSKYVGPMPDGKRGLVKGCRSQPADLDGDSAVGITDFLILLANWG